MAYATASSLIKVDVVSRGSGDEASGVTAEASSAVDSWGVAGGFEGETESAVAVTITDTPSPWVLLTPTPLSDGEGTGVEDSDVITVPSGRYGLQ